MSITNEIIIGFMIVATAAGFWAYSQFRDTMKSLVAAREEAAKLHADRLALERQMRLNFASSVYDISKVITEYVETLKGQESYKPEEAASVLVTVAEGLTGIAEEASEFHLAIRDRV